MGTMRRPTGTGIMQGGSLLMAAGLLVLGLGGRQAIDEASSVGTAAALLTVAGCALFVLGGWIDRQAERHRR